MTLTRRAVLAGSAIAATSATTLGGQALAQTTPSTATSPQADAAQQAPGFYRKLGFELVAEVPDKPVGHTEFVFRRTLADAVQK